jgi:hypothetical protein
MTFQSRSARRSSATCSGGTSPSMRNPAISAPIDGSSGVTVIVS